MSPGEGEVLGREDISRYVSKELNRRSSVNLLDLPNGHTKKVWMSPKLCPVPLRWGYGISLQHRSHWDVEVVMELGRVEHTETAAMDSLNHAPDPRPLCGPQWSCEVLCALTSFPCLSCPSKPLFSAPPQGSRHRTPGFLEIPRSALFK